jgi:hypothetical protein
MKDQNFIHANNENMKLSINYLFKIALLGNEMIFLLFHVYCENKSIKIVRYNKVKAIITEMKLINDSCVN